jgi:hypothetical protein
MLTQVIKEKKARFRIQIYDFKEKKSKTISLKNHNKYNLEDIKERIVQALTKNRG